jgi:hypothetical protein
VIAKKYFENNILFICNDKKLCHSEQILAPGKTHTQIRAVDANAPSLTQGVAVAEVESWLLIFRLSTRPQSSFRRVPREVYPMTVTAGASSES